MFVQDYVMRQIQLLARGILKLIFHIDTESPSSQLLNNTEAKETADELLKKSDRGNIREAENQLSELIEVRSKDNLLIGIVFYSYLNEKDDDFLEANDFSREKIEDGMKHLLSEYGLEGIADLFII